MTQRIASKSEPRLTGAMISALQCCPNRAAVESYLSRHPEHARLISWLADTDTQIDAIARLSARLAGEDAQRAAVELVDDDPLE